MTARARRKPRVSEEMIIGPDEYNDHVVVNPISRHTIEVLFLVLVLIAITGMAVMTLDLIHAIGAVGLAFAVFTYRVFRIQSDQTN